MWERQINDNLFNKCHTTLLPNQVLKLTSAKEYNKKVEFVDTTMFRTKRRGGGKLGMILAAKVMSSKGMLDLIKM